jgi:hypothetical protein
MVLECCVMCVCGWVVIGWLDGGCVCVSVGERDFCCGVVVEEVLVQL